MQCDMIIDMSLVPATIDTDGTIMCHATSTTPDTPARAMFTMTDSPSQPVTSWPHLISLQ
jgi:hypothetical protein